MANNTCDACGEEPGAFMVTNVDNGDTQLLGNYCFVIFGGQLAERLGLTEAPPESADQAHDPEPPGSGEGSARANGRGRRRAASGDSAAPDAAAEPEEAPAASSAESG